LNARPPAPKADFGLGSKVSVFNYLNLSRLRALC
jgi:hypothetical protein